MRFHMQDRNPSYKMFSPFFWKKVNFSFHFTLDIDKVPEASMCLVQKVAYKCILEQHCLHWRTGSNIAPSTQVWLEMLYTLQSNYDLHTSFIFCCSSVPWKSESWSLLSLRKQPCSGFFVLPNNSFYSIFQRSSVRAGNVFIWERRNV